MSLTIREYKSEDNEHVKFFLKENLKYHVDIDKLGLRNYTEGDEVEDYEKFLDKIQNGVSICYIVEEDNDIVGFGYAYKRDDNSAKGHISKIFLLEEYRGKGIGSQLLHLLEKFLIDQGCKHITLSVYAPNKKAHNIYLKEGYKNRFIEMIKII